METNLKYINLICTDLGGVGGHSLNIAGENEICTLLGGTGGHSLEINALNEICTIQGVAAGHSQVLSALNAIAGVTKVTNLEAWKYIQVWTLLNPPYNSDLVFRSKSLSGLSLVDELGNDGSLVLPYFSKTLNTEYLYATDNGNLDIYTNDEFTVCGWIKSETTSKSITGTLFGKACGGSNNGLYQFYTLATSGYVGACLESSTGLINIPSTIDVYDTNWHFLRLDVKQSTKKIRFFVDEVQIGSDVIFTGTFTHLDDKFKFTVGCANNATGTGFFSVSYHSFSDIYVFNKILSESDITNIFTNRINVSGALAHWPMLGYSGYLLGDRTLTASNFIDYDAGGSGYHLIGSASVLPYSYKFVKYSSGGSRHGINVGYTLYDNGFTKVYVPLTDSGQEQDMGSLINGFFKVGTFVGNTTKYNLSNAKLFINNSKWDRSDATIWSDLARDTTTHYDSTSATTKKYWHIDELVNLQMYKWANVNYKGLCFVKFKEPSYGDRTELSEIIAYETNKTGSEYNIALTYCRDYKADGIYENNFIYWKYDTQNIVATRNEKILKLEGSTVYLSIDNGLTYQYSKSVAGLTIIQNAYIWDNGNISFESGTKAYLSTDNLANISEITPKNVIGENFTPSSNQNFMNISPDNFIFIGDIEIRVFSTYSTASDGVTNINLWYSKDNGASLKSFYLINSTEPVLDFNHFHGITYNSSDGSFWAVTGDGNTPKLARWIKFTYNIDTDIWAGVEQVNGDSTSYYKSSALGFYGDDVFWGVDNTQKHAAFKCNISDIANPANYVKISNTNVGNNSLLVSLLANTNGHLFITGNHETIVHSNDYGVSIRASRIYGMPDCKQLIALNPLKSDEWGFVHVADSNSTANNFTKSTTLWFKLK